ncbi:reverse transcriptase domain-containing protein [Tanacetum coccineum]
MLQRCKDANIVLNWEKCHFMVKEGNVLGHKLSSAGLEVDKEKIDVISKLPPLLMSKALEILWDMPLTCDASEFAVRAVLGQKDGKHFHPIYFASKTLNAPQQKYTITEKELMDVVFAFDKFRPYLILSKTIVYTNHSALRHLFKKQGAKPRLIRWILLLQEFDIKIKDKKATANVAANHLSWIDNDETSDDSEVDDNFPGETLMEISTKDIPWFTNFAKIIVAVNYVSKWAKAQALPTNDARVVISFLKKLFFRFGMPKSLISDRGTHFCNKIMEKTMKRYGVTHRFSITYHPQMSGQGQNTNRALKRILENPVKDNPAVWSRKLDDALWAFRCTYQTPTGTTPYKLLYGKNYHLPFEIEHHAYWALKKL